MRIYRLWMALSLAFVAVAGFARNNPYDKSLPKSPKAQYRDVCANSESQIDQSINNVRARLLGGGDCWWDFNDGRYVVPKVDVSTGQAEVSSIFAGSVWLGGVDPAGNLKLACQDYRSGANNEFWPGPLTEFGITEQFTCDNWDRHFEPLQRRYQPFRHPAGCKGMACQRKSVLRRCMGLRSAIHTAGTRRLLRQG